MSKVPSIRAIGRTWHHLGRSHALAALLVAIGGAHSWLGERYTIDDAGGGNALEAR